MMEGFENQGADVVEGVVPHAALVQSEDDLLEVAGQMLAGTVAPVPSRLRGHMDPVAFT